MFGRKPKRNDERLDDAGQNPPQDLGGSSPLRPAQESQLQDGRYAMWWASEGDPDPNSSQTLISIDRFCDAADGIESYVFGKVLHALGHAETFTRVALPSEMIQLAAAVPNGRTLVISVSEEKGIRVQFHADTTSVIHRESVWGRLADYCEGLRREIESLRIPLDAVESHSDRPAEWWHRTRRALSSSQAKDAEFVGVTFLGVQSAKAA